MQLEQVDRLGLEVLQAALDEREQVLVGVAGRGVRREASSGFRGDHDRFPSLPLQPSDEALAVAVTVDVRRVDEVDAEIDGLVQGRHRFLVVDRSPRAANGPRAKPGRRHLPPGPSQLAILHLPVSLDAHGVGGSEDPPYVDSSAVPGPQPERRKVTARPECRARRCTFSSVSRPRALSPRTGAGTCAGCSSNSIVVSSPSESAWRS